MTQTGPPGAVTSPGRLVSPVLPRRCPDERPARAGLLALLSGDPVGSSEPLVQYRAFVGDPDSLRGLLGESARTKGDRGRPARAASGGAVCGHAPASSQSRRPPPQAQLAPEVLLEGPRGGDPGRSAALRCRKGPCPALFPIRQRGCCPPSSSCGKRCACAPVSALKRNFRFCSTRLTTGQTARPGPIPPKGNPGHQGGALGWPQTLARGRALPAYLPSEGPGEPLRQGDSGSGGGAAESASPGPRGSPPGAVPSPGDYCPPALCAPQDTGEETRRRESRVGLTDVPSGPCREASPRVSPTGPAGASLSRRPGVAPGPLPALSSPGPGRSPACFKSRASRGRGNGRRRTWVSF